jgi:hypothetical protein
MMPAYKSDPESFKGRLFLEVRMATVRDIVTMLVSWMGVEPFRV